VANCLPTTQHWIRAGCFEFIEDLRSLRREFAGRRSQPTAMTVDSRTLQSALKSGSVPETKGQAA
jgi:hypothetical protein